MKANVLRAVFLLWSIFAANSAMCDVVLVGTPLDTTVTTGYVIGATASIQHYFNFMAQSFILNEVAYVTRIDTVIVVGAPDNSTLQLTL